MSSFLNHNTNRTNRRPPSSHLLGRRPAASGNSRGILNSRRASSSGGTSPSLQSSFHRLPTAGTAFNRNRNANNAGCGEGTVANCFGGQVQLERTTQRVGAQKQQQHQEGKQETLKEGQIDMEEVLQDIAILEQQQLESERLLQSAKLVRQEKLQLKAAQESKLSKLKYENGSMRADLQRANKELAIRHRQLIEARSRCDNSRKEQNRFDAKLKRTLGVARVLGSYRKKIEYAMMSFNETETRLSFLRGQIVNKLNAATLRRDDARHRNELLAKANQTIQMKERAVVEDVSKIRAEKAGNERDLSSAQQIESQTKLRVETIEYEMSMENSRHVESMAVLVTKNEEADQSKAVSLESVHAKTTMIEAKKAELSEIWEKCNVIRRAEGLDILPLPKWGVEHAQYLDVSRIKGRVDAEESERDTKMTRRAELKGDVAQAESLAERNLSEASKIQADTEMLLNKNMEGHTAELRRQNECQKVVKEADDEHLAVEDLRRSIETLSETYKNNAVELEQLISSKDENITLLQKEIDNTFAELKTCKKRVDEEDALHVLGQSEYAKALADSKERKCLVEKAFERAQERARDFSIQPDDELVAELKKLDDDEDAIRRDVEGERDNILSREPFLNNIRQDHESSVPLDEQAEGGMMRLRKYCLEFILLRKDERNVLLDAAKDAHFAHLKNEELARREEEEKRRKIFEKEREEKRRVAAAEMEREKNEARRRAHERAKAEKRRIASEAEMTKNREEERHRVETESKRRAVAELKRRSEDEGAASAEKERKKHESRHRAHEKAKAEKRRIALEAEKMEAQELEERRRTETESKRLAVIELKRRAEEEVARDKEREVAKKKKEQDMKEIRAKSREVQEKFRIEGELKQKEREPSRRKTADITTTKTGLNDNKFEEASTGKADIDNQLHSHKKSKVTTNHEDANKSSKHNELVNSRQQTQKDVIVSKTARESLLSERTYNKRSKASLDEQPRKHFKSDIYDEKKIETTHTQRSVPSQSALRKNSKRPKSTSGVRFDQSANRPKLDIFSSGVHGKSKEKQSSMSKSKLSSSSRPSTQTSGISSCEGAVRRRKKVSTKSKSSSLALCGFDDDAGFLQG